MSKPYLKIAALLLLLAGQALGADQRQWLDGIVAVVNDDVITRTELERQLQAVRRQLQQQDTRLPAPQALRPQVLERMILARLQLQLAEKGGIRIDDATLERTLQNIAAQNRLGLKEFRDVLERDGYDFDSFREDLRRDITINRLRQREVDSRLTVTEQEIDHYLTTLSTQGSADDQYLLGHILVAVPEAATPERIDEARAKAADLLAQLRAGADFAQLAVSHSSGQQALQGGDLGWRKLGQLPTLFAGLAPAMKKGQVSEPIRSPSGFHLIMLKDRRAAGEERQLITQTLARHILVRPNTPGEEPEAQLHLERLRQRIQNGEDFAAIAHAHSEDRASAANGGSLGWVGPGETVPEFEGEMQELAPQAISKPFKSRYGWHIVQVLERRQHDNTDEQRRARAREAIHQRRVEEESELWLRRLRDEAYVEIVEAP